MSAYTSETAILGEIQLKDLIALTDDAPRMGKVNQTVLNQVIQNASGYIDSKCANLYGTQLPFFPVPSSVANMALTIACYRLYRRREVPGEKNKFYDEFQEVKQFLDRVNTGDAHIDDLPTRDFAQVVSNVRPTIYGGATSNWPSNSM